MASIRWYVWCGVAGIALVVTLCVLPSTGWVPRMQGWVAAGTLHKDGSWMGEIDSTYSYATILEGALPEHPTTLREELLKAILIHDGDQRRTALHELSCKYPRDAFVQSEMGRYATMMGVRAPTSPKSLNAAQASEETVRQERRAEVARWLVSAAARGEAADPDNAQFPILAAAGLYALGEVRQARATLMRAADKTEYRDYSREESELLATPLRGRLFSGNYAVLQADASIMLPYYSHYKYLTRLLANWGTPRERTEARIKLLKLADTISRRADIYIAVVVAVSCAKSSVRPERGNENALPRSDQGQYSDSEYLDWARRLQAQAVKEHVAVDGFDPVKSMKMQLAIGRAAKEFADRAPTSLPPSPYSGLTWSAALLVGLFALWPAAALFAGGQALRQRDAWAEALPVLPALVAVGLFATKSADQWVACVAILLVLALVAAFVERYRPTTRFFIFGAIALGCTSCLAVPPGQSLAFFAACVLAVTWTLSRIRGPRWLAWGAVSLQVVCVTALAMAFLVADSQSGTILGHLLSPVVIMLLGATFGPRQKLPVYAFVGPAVLAGAIVYGFSVRQIVTVDRGALATINSYRAETATLRAMAQEEHVRE